MTAKTIRRNVETCPYCGAWNSFRKGKNGKSVVDPASGVRRIYGHCKECGNRLVLVNIPPKDTPGGGENA